MKKDNFFLKSAILFCGLLLIFWGDLLPGGAKAATVCSQIYQPVCGVDNHTYPNACEAQAAGVDVSYQGVCRPIANPKLARQDFDLIRFAGALIEIGSTDLPTTIILRRDGTDKDYVVNVSQNTVLGQDKYHLVPLSSWIPGDQIILRGEINENTQEIDASQLINVSYHLRSEKPVNGWITKIDLAKHTITYQWYNKEHTFQYDSHTHFVAGLKNPATAADLKIGDRIRGRVVEEKDALPLAKMVVVLRRGRDLFMKIRTFVPRATLVRLSSTILPTTIQVKIDPTPGLRKNDVNNLIGTAGKLVTVNITPDTRIVRKFFGIIPLNQLAIGDKLIIIGRVNDDGTVDAKVIRDLSLWQTVEQGYAGKITEINAEKGYLKIEWTPVKYLDHQQLRKMLANLKKEAKKDYHAQLEASSATTTWQGLLKKAQKLTSSTTSTTEKAHWQQKVEKKMHKMEEKVGKIMRRLMKKMVKIGRIKLPESLTLGKMIKRLPSRSLRIDVTKDTQIIVGPNQNASLTDLKVGDLVRVRGVHAAKLPIVTADKIVAVPEIPAITAPLSAPLDKINEFVSVWAPQKGLGLMPHATSSTEKLFTSSTISNFKF